jgi:hypothetical protein
MTAIETIRERRQNAVKRALGVLEVCKTADAETRGSLLKSVVSSLTDSAVVSAWIALTASEQDANIRRNMIRSLANVDFRQIQDLPACITLLVSCLNDPDSRAWALDALSRLAPADPAVIDPLIAIYEKQRSAKDQREILSALCQRDEFPPQLCAFMISKLDTFDADFKTYIVARLLSQDALPTASFEKLLLPSEPTRIKFIVMEHIADRSLTQDKAVTAVLQSDKDSACRLEAVWLLTESGELSPDCVAAILKAAMADPAPKVRENALLSFEHTLNKSPRVIEFLLQALDKETRPEYVRLILHLTMPHLQRHSKIIEAYTRFLSKNVDSKLAAEFYEALAKAIAWMPQLVDALIVSYTNEKDDRTKAALLKALATVVAQDERLVKIYVDALKLPEPQIQQWGIDGLMMLPLSEKNVPIVAEMTAALLIEKIPYDLRLAAAKKIARIPDKPKPLLARLKEVAEQAKESELAKVCEKACVSAAATTEADNSQWDSWIHLADVEHRAEGIFPAIYTEYFKAPEKAQRVLKALLNPKCIDSLYATYGYEVNEHTILGFLGKRKAVDDEVSQYCLSRILGGAEGSLESYLRCLIANPKFPALKTNVWTLFERGGGSSALLRELLSAAFGGIDGAGSALTERISKPMPPATLSKYITLLTENVGWPPSKALLKQLSKRKDLSVEASKQINEALAKFGDKPDESDASASGPGFADE